MQYDPLLCKKLKYGLKVVAGSDVIRVCVILALNKQHGEDLK